jgi:hypothetical protein
MTPTRRSRVLALLACTAVVTTSVAYALLLQQQDSPATTPWEALHGAPTWVLAVLAASGATTAAAIFQRPSLARRVLLLATAAVLFGVGVIAAFSIGLGLILAGAFSVGAALTDRSGAHTSALGAPLP